MEKAKFPMPSMNITCGYNDRSHEGSFALDMAGEDTGIDWVLAPYTGKIVKTLSGAFGNWIWFESLEPVLCANGEATKLTCMFGHDNKMRHKIGDIIKQGEHLCAEGTSGNANGNHCHMEVGIGSYVGTWYQNSCGVWMIYNAVEPHRYLCLPDDYKIKVVEGKVRNGGLNWIRESEVKEPQAQTKTLVLPSSATSWRVYPLNASPVVGNECAKLAPSKYGGLEYEIKGWTQPDVAIIDTQMFGRVQIYVAPNTGAIIK